MNIDLDATIKNAKFYGYAAHPDVFDLANTVIDLAIELRAARKVVEAARDALDDMDPMFRTTQRLEDALKELDKL